MKNTKRIKVASLFIAFMIIAVPALAAFPVDTILSPLMTNPAVVETSRDSVLHITLAAGFSPEKVALKDQAGNMIPLENITAENITSFSNPGEYSADLGQLGLEDGLYDLMVAAAEDDKKTKDTQERAVWVMGRAPEEITFAHIADTHYGDPRAVMASSVETPTERRLKVYREASESGALFLIITGDIDSVPGNYRMEYKGAYSEMEENISIPLFLTTGNHDLYTTSATTSKHDGLTFWHRYFGPDRYSFRLGGMEFIAMNTYDWPAKYRNFMNQNLMRDSGSYASGAISREQMDWVKNELATAKEEGLAVVCAGHHEPTKNLAQPKEKTPGENVPRTEVADTLADGGALAFMAGHTHETAFFNYKTMKIFIAASASSDIPRGDSWGYNLCKLKDHEVNCDYITVVKQK